jgi:hypothetical protein
MMVDRVETFTDDELERELTIAASTRGKLRIKRFEDLVAEASRRRECLTSRTTTSSGTEGAVVQRRPWDARR